MARIMIIENDPQVRRELISLLKEEGIEILEAEDINAAVAIINQFDREK